MKYLLFFASLLLFTTCAEDTSLQKDLIGVWDGVDWIRAGKSFESRAQKVRFTFGATDTYSAIFGNQEENGTYYVKGSSLYTTAEDKIEKMVGISFSGDTLHMEMNRVGTPETLVFTKTK